MNTRSIRFRLTVWYAGLLAALLVLFGISVYFGLARYLEWSLQDSLAKQAQQIAANHLADVGLTAVLQQLISVTMPSMFGHIVEYEA